MIDFNQETSCILRHAATLFFDGTTLLRFLIELSHVVTPHPPDWPVGIRGLIEKLYFFVVKFIPVFVSSSPDLSLPGFWARVRSEEELH